MTSYLIIYSCKSSVKKFKKADSVIKACAWDDRWFYHLNNTWIIKSEMTADQIGKKLLASAIGNDDFLVIEIVDNYSCWLPQQALNYMQNIIFNKEIE